MTLGNLEIKGTCQRYRFNHKRLCLVATLFVNAALFACTLITGPMFPTMT